MTRRTKLVAGGAALLAVIIVGGAVAATKAFSPEQERQAIINDAARQLGVEPQELSNALEQALKNRVDEAVRDGRLTREEGARLKERIDAGDAPLFGLGPEPGFGFRHEVGPGPFAMKFEAAAEYLGMTQAELHRALRGGKSLAQVARDRGKSVEGLVDALVANAEAKLERAVEAGKLTEAEKREMLSGLRERLTNVVNGRFPDPPGPGFGFRHDGPGPFEAKFEAAAEYLGMTQAELHRALRGGKSLAQVARDRGKSVEGLVDALVANAEAKLERAVEAGKLTEAEKREMLSGLRERLTDIVNGRFPQPPEPSFRDGMPEPEVRPAIF
jgi:DNA-binding phage protein/outer membrane murein-binding lipoprotein Lpp